MKADDIDKKIREIQHTGYDNESKSYITFMCKKGCKFYKNRCTKNRLIRECAKKGLKNID